jgi:hypothetical protein
VQYSNIPMQESIEGDVALMRGRREEMSVVCGNG